MNLVWLRKKKIHARPKLATLLATTLISGLFVSIPMPAIAAACNPTSTTASNGDTEADSKSYKQAFHRTNYYELKSKS